MPNFGQGEDEALHVYAKTLPRNESKRKLMTLIWDGLQVQVPMAMEPLILDCGYIRLSGPDMPIVDMRFGAAKGSFDPHKDGSRILREAGLAKEAIKPCKESWSRTLPGLLYSSSRLYCLQFRESPGVVAARFSAPPSTALVEKIFVFLKWSSPETWRRWACYDIRFETPPHYVLQKAVFRPGRFHLAFRKNKSTLIFERFAPANILLDKRGLVDWYKDNFLKTAGADATILSRSDTEVDVFRQASFLTRKIPWLASLTPAFRWKIRHIVADNKILVTTEMGPPLPDQSFQRIHDSYATGP